MSTYLVKHGGVLLTNLYYGPREMPKVGQVLSLKVVVPDENVWANTTTPASVSKQFKIVSIGEAPSGLQDAGADPEPTIYVEPVV